MDFEGDPSFGVKTNYKASELSSNDLQNTQGKLDNVLNPSFLVSCINYIMGSIS